MRASASLRILYKTSRAPSFPFAPFVVPVFPSKANFSPWSMSLWGLVTLSKGRMDNPRVLVWSHEMDPPPTTNSSPRPLARLLEEAGATPSNASRDLLSPLAYDPVDPAVLARYYAQLGHVLMGALPPGTPVELFETRSWGADGSAPAKESTGAGLEVARLLALDAPQPRYYARVGATGSGVLPREDRAVAWRWCWLRHPYLVFDEAMTRAYGRDWRAAPGAGPALCALADRACATRPGLARAEIPEFVPIGVRAPAPRARAESTEFVPEGRARVDGAARAESPEPSNGMGPRVFGAWRLLTGTDDVLTLWWPAPDSAYADLVLPCALEARGLLIASHQ